MNTTTSAADESKNKGLLFFLWFKIIMTLLVWSTPLLLPDPLLNLITRLLFGVDFEPKIFFHLLFFVEWLLSLFLNVQLLYQYQ